MPPKAADKKPASKAPATASKAPEKKDAGKKTAATGEKKKRTKTRKETYSSYIYKGEFERCFPLYPCWNSVLIYGSSQAGAPRYWYLQPCHVHPELFCQW